MFTHTISSLAVATGLALGLAACGESGGSKPAGPTVAGPNGQKLFAVNCAVCHGDTGKGDGISAATLAVKPRNLTTEPYKYVDIAGVGDEVGALVEYIKVGRVENGMPPFGHLAEPDIKALATFVSGIRPEPNFVEKKPAEPNAPAGGGEGGGG